MKRTRSIGLAVALSLLSIGSGYAAGMVRISEPGNGFVKAENPEWTAGHAYAKQSNPAHRLYHRNADAELALWLRQNALSRENASSAAAKRAFSRQRNMLHRQWHLVKSDPLNVQSEGSSMLQIFYSNSEVTIVEPAASVTAAHTITGPAPSRRSIVEATEERNKTHAVEVGRQ